MGRLDRRGRRGDGIIGSKSVLWVQVRVIDQDGLTSPVG